ncbi:TetR/AcrR family transcriptional regulator [Photobacterium leiognathi]|uniref:TetR/AcrR family transcriptional regulator n=1 Tax=Photobacterium leiognathi TaxID=553611 RepID=UPI0029817E44|nr:TetR/AcrR family transcriptional regulator [Photobacterium leiognathi]
MARITAEERAQKKQALDEMVISIFMNEGWDHVTYDRLAKEFNVRKSSIQAYYPNSIMFATALQGKVLPLVMPLLNFTSKQAFIDSWLKAYKDEQQHIFKEVVKMLLDNILKDGTSPYARGAVLKLQEMLAANIGEKDAEEAMKMVFGEIIYTRMNF